MTTENSIIQNQKMNNIKYYNDINIRFRQNGERELLANILAINEEIYNILGTSNIGSGERPMEPEFGCSLAKYIKRPMDEDTALLIKLEIIDAIDRWLGDRIQILTAYMAVLPDYNEQIYVCFVPYIIIKSNQIGTFKMTLEDEI